MNLRHHISALSWFLLVAFCAALWMLVAYAVIM